MDELRARLRRVEQDAAAARILAGGADRDVGELGREFREFRDQNNRVLNAMREDLTDLRGEMRRGFASVDERFAQVDRNFEQVNRRFEQVNRNFEQVDRNFLTVTSKIDGVAAGLQVITDLLTRRDGDDRPAG
jgi:methyl-accepting chemotaxis protein